MTIFLGLLIFAICFSGGNSVEPDCYVIGEDGKNTYTGNKSTTITGRICQRWDVTDPHTHTHVNDPEAKENYCRVLSDNKPWCYTVDRSVRWEYCGIPECAKEDIKDSVADGKFPLQPSIGNEYIDCYEKGENYMGNASTTFTGLTCQRWDVQKPHKHEYTNHAHADGNFCRIINDERPWCYTVDPSIRWEYCMVPDCESIRILQELRLGITTQTRDTQGKTTRQEYLTEQQTAEWTTTETTPTTKTSPDQESQSIIEDKITTKGPGALHVTKSGIKTNTAASRSLVRSRTISIAGPIQTSGTDLNPDVYIQKEMYTSSVNQKISIRCFVTPNQDLPIHWYKDGELLVEKGLKIRTGSILILKNVQRENSGKYTCEAGNSKATTTVLIGEETHYATQDTVDKTTQDSVSTTEKDLTSTTDIIFTSEVPINLRTDHGESLTTTPFKIVADYDITTTSPEEITTSAATSSQTMETTTQQVSTTEAYVSIAMISTPPPSKQLPDELPTTTIRSMLSTETKQAMQDTEEVSTTTLQYRTSTSDHTEQVPLIPDDSDISYSIKDKVPQEITTSPLVILFNKTGQASSGVNYNVKDQGPDAFKLTIPVRHVFEPPNNTSTQVPRGLRERYVKPSTTKPGFKMDKMEKKKLHSYPYLLRSDTKNMIDPSSQYLRETNEQSCGTKCDGESTCYLGYNCTHYKHCFEQDGSHCTCILMTCSFGTFWNSAIRACDAVSKVYCEEDPCKSMNPYATYSSGFNCRSYYECNKERRSVAMCCKNKYSYQPYKGRCVFDESCDIDCTSRTPNKLQRDLKVNLQVTQTYDLCYLRPVKGRPTKYFNNVFKVEQDCPPGTTFNAEICVCGISLKITRKIPIDLYPAVCEPKIVVDFSGQQVTNQAPRPVYLKSTDVNIIPSGMLNINYGQFNGRSSQIFSERYFAVTFRRLLIRMRFYNDGRGGPENQVLISNCDSLAKSWNIPELDPNKKPSLAIILSRSTSTLTFLGFSEFSPPAIIRLPFSKTSWNNVELIYDGTTFDARVRTIKKDGKLLEFKDSKPLSGRLAVSVQPLRIGKCSRMDAFYGYIDIIKMYNDCLPKNL
ncbi:uncharacterized protein LOC133188924 [Saccostrea echinata]|uniref:uncharacterized protein LOC133188924 n=1 Tax=Saccostrea echinata TaxID=191078 RepID=UPI002A8186B2|nr:uncharacterized protein LOC133188924 [Saccostrea echinata]